MLKTPKTQLFYGFNKQACLRHFEMYLNKFIQQYQNCRNTKSLAGLPLLKDMMQFNLVWHDS